NSGSANSASKLSNPTQYGSVTKLTCWKLSRIPRTSGYQEKSAKQTPPPARNAYARRLSRTRRCRRERAVFRADEVRRGERAGRGPAVRTAIFPPLRGFSGGRLSGIPVGSGSGTGRALVPGGLR